MTGVADFLYDLDAGEFVAARDRLARELRQAGDRATAEQVRKLRRPTVVAWVLNQLARRHRHEVVELLTRGEAVAAAQREALAGNASTLRAADRARRETIGHLLAIAAGMLPAAGRATLEEIEASLHAASLDPGHAGARLREGRLSLAIPAASGFDPALAGWEPGAAAGPAMPARTRADRPAPGERGPHVEGSGEADRRARTAARRRAREEASRRVGELTGAADAAEAEVARIEGELARLQAGLDDARRRARSLRREAAGALRELRRLEG